MKSSISKIGGQEWERRGEEKRGKEGSRGRENSDREMVVVMVVGVGGPFYASKPHSTVRECGQRVIDFVRLCSQLAVDSKRRCLERERECHYGPFKSSFEALQKLA